MLPKQDWFCLFFPEPLDGIDTQNLITSGVRRVQVFFKTALAIPAMLTGLAALGVRVILRVEEDDYYDDGAPSRVVDGVRAIMQLVQVEAVIVGNEPEQGYDLTVGSPNWGNNPDALFAKGKAFEHAYAFDGVRKLLVGLHVKVVSPGWSCNRMTPNDAPQPGRETWERICSMAYGQADYNGAHVYVLNWLGDEDSNRYKWELGNEEERCHKPLWINECNSGSSQATAVQHMAAVLQMADIARTHPQLASRVASFCPFVSNGLGPPSYPMAYVMKDPRCYELVAAWMQR